MLKIFRHFCGPAILAASFCSPAPAAPSPYTLAQTIPLPGGIKWDYLHFDGASGRIYISHGDEVTVVDAQTNKVIGALTGLPGSHGIAVDPASGLVYADSATNRQAVAFDPKTFKPVATAPVVLDADGMAYDAPSRQVFVTGGDGNALTPISTATNKPAADIPLGGAPEFLASDGAGSLYQNLADQREVVRIDTATNKIVARWPVGACVSPHGLAVDPAARRLLVTCKNSIALVLDADTGKTIATLRIGKGSDAAAFDPAKNRFFSSNGDGTLTVIGASGAGKFAVLATVKTAPGARTMAVDPASGRIFLVTATVQSTAPAAGPNDHPHYTFAPGSLKLLILDPAK